MEMTCRQIKSDADELDAMLSSNLARTFRGDQ
jgi:hypothetical protein